METCDIVIIGAGLSGLSARNDLLKADSTLSVISLEAKDRVGGRTVGQYLKCANGSELFDLGGQWVGCSQVYVMRLISELGLSTYPQYTDGYKITHAPPYPIIKYTGDLPPVSYIALLDFYLVIRKLNIMMQTIPLDDPTKAVQALEWDSMTAEQGLRAIAWTEAVIDGMQVSSRVVFGCELAELSMLYFLYFMHMSGGFEVLVMTRKGDANELKIKECAATLSQRLAEKFGNVRLNTAVSHIEQTEEYAIVTTKDGSKIKCRQVISAVPPNCLLDIEMTPPLPQEKVCAIQCIRMGKLLKFVLTYKKAFWRSAGCSGELVSTGVTYRLPGCTLSPLSVTFDATTQNGYPALVGFIGGEQLVQYADASFEDRRHAVVECLKVYFGPEAESELIEYCEKNWCLEAYNGGCPVSLVAPGGMTRFAPALRKPFQRLHFAGTESSSIWPGYMEGAVISGYRAAREVLSDLNPAAIDNIPDLHYDVYDHLRKRSSATSLSSFQKGVSISVATALAVGAGYMFLRHR